MKRPRSHWSRIRDVRIYASSLPVAESIFNSTYPDFRLKGGSLVRGKLLDMTTMTVIQKENGIVFYEDSFVISEDRSSPQFEYLTTLI